MNDVLNQEQTTASAENPAVEEEGFFDDFTEDDVIPASTEEDQSPETEVNETRAEKEPQVAESAQDSPFLEIVYNKEAKGLTKDEAIELAQKGMNYDKVFSSYSLLKQNEPILNDLIRLAEVNNMSVEDYVNSLNEVQKEFDINQEIEALKQKYPGSDDSALRELATLQVKERNANKSKSIEESKRATADARRNEISRQLDIFNQRYPDLDPQKLDKGVYSLMANGYTLLEAYESVEAEKRSAIEQERQSKEKISRQNEENRKKSLGNTTNMGSVESDDFLEGFLNG